MKRGMFRGAVICILILSMYLGNMSYQMVSLDENLYLGFFWIFYTLILK